MIDTSKFSDGDTVEVTVRGKFLASAHDSAHNFYITSAGRLGLPVYTTSTAYEVVEIKKIVVLPRAENSVIILDKSLTLIRNSMGCWTASSGNTYTDEQVSSKASGPVSVLYDAGEDNVV